MLYTIPIIRSPKPYIITSTIILMRKTRIENYADK